MNLRLVTLDATNTIIRFSIPPAHHYARVASLYEVSLNVSKIDQAFRKVFKQHSISFPNFGVRDNGWQYWWSNVIKETITLTSGKTVDGSVLTNIADHLINLYSTAEAYEIVPGFSCLVENLSKLGLTIGTISNTDERLEQILINLKIHHHFHFILTSYSAKVMKPDLAIFQCAINRSRREIKPFEALHIGDTLDIDYLGAKKAQWNSILVSANYEEQCKNLNVCVDKRLMFSSLVDVSAALKDIIVT